ncbi:MAG: manganese efflux pump MntP family protein [Firmicutes bacterium]|nr:manganese efflux pump MntP family protein [Bacillota bacterium]
MDWWFVAVTAILVSLDALFVGVMLGLKKRQSAFVLAYIALITFGVCLLAGYIGSLLQLGIEALISGAVFIIIGIRNMFSLKNADSGQKPQFGLVETTFLALALSVDGAAAALGLSLENQSIWFVSGCFAAAGFVLMIIGLVAGKWGLTKFIKKVFWLPGLLLVLMGIHKIAGFFFYSGIN